MDYIRYVLTLLYPNDGRGANRIVILFQESSLLRNIFSSKLITSSSHCDLTYSMEEKGGETMGWLIVLVLMVLFFVMMFGIGFILNMLMKTTWFPAYIFVLVIVPIVVYTLWNHDKSFGSYLASFRLVDYLTAIAGFGGAILSGWTIEKLRKGGYRMF